MPEANAFLPGAAQPPSPLERYLPPVPAGVVAGWLGDNVPLGSWVLDPFGASPHWAVEAARAGYRVLVAANNPVARFLIEMHALPPSAEALTAALAELGAARRGDERLEPAILELYTTECPNCKAQVAADAFIWQREAAAPHAKLIDCKLCGQQGEYPCDEADAERAAAYQRGGPYLSRALERIASKGDPDREHAEEALEAYLPRAAYALITIINRIDGLSLDEEQRRLISALVLSACDRATKLWAHPSGRLRPKQLSAPAQFREYNLWREMERSIALWAQPSEPITLAIWPEQAPVGGISLYEGRARDLAEEFDKVQIAAVAAALPRPTPAFWTLCALWAGWLWGREAIGPFALVLRRKRYDWAWHTEALHSSFSALAEKLPPRTPIFGLVTESEIGFNAAAAVAANLADLPIQTIAYRHEAAELQLGWRTGQALAEASPPAEAVRSAAEFTLNGRGQPSPFDHVHAAALNALSKQAQMGAAAGDPAELYAQTRENIEVGIKLRGGFERFGGSEQALDSGLWWLSDESKARSPLADRVEIATVRHLLRRPGRTLTQIDAELCRIFPGLLTPPRPLLAALLNSYAQESDDAWRLVEEDQPRKRRADLAEMRAGLRKLGEQLGYQVSAGAAPLRWQLGGQTALCFYVIASAVLGEVLLKAETPPEKSLIVLPGRRAPLALHKIEHDPRLAGAISSGWRFVKFRYVRRLIENEALTRESFLDSLELDPLTAENLQAPLL